MNEVTKLYENAGIEKKEKGYCDCDYMNCPNPDIEPCGKECCYWVDKGIDYPPFTAEKQLEIVKFLLNHSVYYDVDDKGNYWFHISDDCYTYYYNKFEIALANIINEMWQDLTEEERKQIRGILE